MIKKIRFSEKFYVSIYPWFICLIGMLFYGYNYFLRIFPSIMHDKLVVHFNLTATQFGTLASAYYFAYAPLQIPIGILYDYLGPRLVLFFACLVAVFGVGAFTLAATFPALLLGRLLMGMGTAFAYVGVLKLASIWLGSRHFATAAGMATALGMSSAIFSELCLVKIVHLLGYKPTLFLIIGVGLGLSILILSFIRNKPFSKEADFTEPALPFVRLIASLKQIVTNKQLWLIGIVSCLTYIPVSVFLDVWAPSYLESYYHLSLNQAGKIISAAFLGWILTAPLIGFLSDSLGNRKLFLLASSLVAATLFIFLLSRPLASLSQLYLIFFVIGAVCSIHPLCFALGKECNSNEVCGTVVAVINAFTMLSGIIFQPLVGSLLDWYAKNVGLFLEEAPYVSNQYIFALSIIPLSLCLAAFLNLFIKDTYQNKIKANKV